MEEGWKFVSRVLVTFYQIHLVERVTTRSQGCFPEGFLHRYPKPDPGMRTGSASPLR